MAEDNSATHSTAAGQKQTSHRSSSKRPLFEDEVADVSFRKEYATGLLFPRPKEDTSCELLTFHIEIEGSIAFESHRNTGVSKSNRSILVDWLVSVHAARAFSTNALFLAISILDRYCAVAMEYPDKKTIQLYGITSLLLATKYHERHPLTAQQCAYYTAGAFTVKQVLEAESKILPAIGFRLSVPTVHTFAHIFFSAVGADHEVTAWTGFIAERVLYNFEMTKFRPSLIALSVLNIVLSKSPNMATKVHQDVTEALNAHILSATQCSEEEVLACMAMINNQLLEPTLYAGSKKRKLDAVDKKYHQSL